MPDPRGSRSRSGRRRTRPGPAAPRRSPRRDRPWPGPDPTEVMRNRSCSSWSRLRTHGSSRRAATMATIREPGQSERRLAERPLAGVHGRRCRIAASATPTRSCMTAPAEQRLLGRAVGRPPPAEGDVDDDHRRRQGDAQADQRGRDRLEPGDDEGEPAIAGRQDDLGGSSQQDRPVVAAQPR